MKRYIAVFLSLTDRGLSPASSFIQADPGFAFFFTSFSIFYIRNSDQLLNSVLYFSCTIILLILPYVLDCCSIAEYPHVSFFKFDCFVNCTVEIHFSNFHLKTVRFSRLR